MGELTEKGKISSLTTELLTIGRTLSAELGGEEITAVILCHAVSNTEMKKLFTFGADKVHVLKNNLFHSYQSDLYLAVMEKVCLKIFPRILLFGHNLIGREIAPRLAFRFGTSVATDCVDLSIDKDSKSLLMTRPVFGGKAVAVLRSRRGYPQIATLRSKAVSPSECGKPKECQTSVVDYEIDSSPMKVKTMEQICQKETARIKLEEAEIVVCGGRGMGDHALQELEQLADLMGGAIGCTKGLCDQGKVPSTCQIGITGKIVSPKLYVGIALSGSSQHLAGCSRSKTLVAINKDPEANIFKVAKYGVVGDYEKVVPAFREKLKELLSRD
jgi:electron transfer flavoprotein alpha subunit